MIHIMLKFNVTAYDLGMGHQVYFLSAVMSLAPPPLLLGIGLHPRDQTANQPALIQWSFYCLTNYIVYYIYSMSVMQPRA